MRSWLSLLSIGLILVTPLVPQTHVQAAEFDYSKVRNFTTRPIQSNDVLDFFGDINNNEGYIVSNNLDPNAPDAGHPPTALNALPFTGYNTIGRQSSPIDTGATRTGSLENVTCFSNLFNYLQTNNISFSSLGFSYGTKEGIDFTRGWTLGEDKLGQDWFATPDSPIEERLHRANPDEAEFSLSYGTTKIITFGYSDVYFVADNGTSPDFTDNFNVFWTDPVSAFKVSNLDPIASGIADAFLQDITAAGGQVQFVSEDPNLVAELTEYNGYRITNINLVMELRAVSSVSVPEYSSNTVFWILSGLGIMSCLYKVRNKT